MKISRDEKGFVVSEKKKKKETNKIRQIMKDVCHRNKFTTYLDQKNKFKEKNKGNVNRF